VFDHVLVNTDHSIPIPDDMAYSGYEYVQWDSREAKSKGYRVVEGKFLEHFIGCKEGKDTSIYHDSDKIGRAVMKLFNEVVFRKG
jgi:hypothetical protein